MSAQRLPLDRWVALSYIGAGALLAACPRAPAPLVPLPLAPGDRRAAVAWAQGTLPVRATAIRFRWKYRDSERRWGGRGQARIAPPDSLRFDWVGPLGLGAGAAVIVGDTAVWADPEKNFRSLVPAVRILWAGLGVVRPPPEDAAVFSHADSARDGGEVRIWRFARGDDTLDYRETNGGSRVLEAEWRRAGKIVARSFTRFGAAGPGEGLRPASTRLDFPEGPARFEFSVVAVDTAAVLDPALWRRRR